MRRTLIDDCWGVRWTVRAAYDRHLRPERDQARRNREPELRSWLGPALAPRPGRLPVEQLPARGSMSDPDHRLVHPVVALGEVGGPWALVGAITHGIRFLREPTASSWTVELHARGRIRRGATWRVGSRAEAESVLEVVAEAVRLGHVPQPAGALLIDVVDERLTVHGALR
jgi:hypothetical protein